MKIVTIKRKAHNKIKNYITTYKTYYKGLYSDTGIWAENQIVFGYETKAKEMYDDIIATLENYFQNDILHFSNNTTIIPWKKKFLKITFSETKNTRIIEDLEIQ